MGRGPAGAALPSPEFATVVRVLSTGDVAVPVIRDGRRFTRDQSGGGKQRHCRDVLAGQHDPVSPTAKRVTRQALSTESRTSALIRCLPPGEESAGWPVSARYFSHPVASEQSRILIAVSGSSAFTESTTGLLTGAPLLTSPL